jgi:hypothetical protein
MKVSLRKNTRPKRIEILIGNEFFVLKDYKEILYIPVYIFKMYLKKINF